MAFQHKDTGEYIRVEALDFRRRVVTIVRFKNASVAAAPTLWDVQMRQVVHIDGWEKKSNRPLRSYTTGPQNKGFAEVSKAIGYALLREAGPFVDTGEWKDA